MIDKKTDFPNIRIAWHLTGMTCRQVVRDTVREERLAPFFAAAAADRDRFRRLLETIRSNEVWELHRRLDARVTLFGVCLSERDTVTLGNLRWARDELRRMHPHDIRIDHVWEF
jgi:hypothetical protein